ncbi:MAG: histidinol-phosphatase [Phycisphaerae bacterium]|nr:histidinol-phosphatase [Phycisphaerae bacterium]
MEILHRLSMRILLWTLLLICTAAALPARAGEETGPRWWKGNLHTHTFWSDGNDFPEMVVQWYKDHGYHFLALSDHNVLSQGQRWIAVTDARRAAFDKYLTRFGDGWVETRQNDKGETEVRLKPLTEYRCLFEESGRFLLIQSEEISDKAHLNGIDLIEVIPPQGGATMAELLQNNIDAVHAQQAKTGQAMLVHVNHPNFQWALTAEDMIGLQGFRFFEVYNAHGYVNNEGDAQRASTERMWDILLARRLAELGSDIVYGVATDDAHNYHKFDTRAANPGQAWIVVRAAKLTPESIMDAMNAGDFYCSTGVTLKDVAFDGTTLTVAVDPEPGVHYSTQFIGTRRGYDPASQAVTDAEGKEIRTTRRYSKDIGAVLAEVEGVLARYQFQGDEIYVRAKVVSSHKNDKSHVPDECESAWVQPVVVRP